MQNMSWTCYWAQWMQSSAWMHIMCIWVTIYFTWYCNHITIKNLYIYIAYSNEKCFPICQKFFFLKNRMIINDKRVAHLALINHWLCKTIFKKFKFKKICFDIQRFKERSLNEKDQALAISNQWQTALMSSYEILKRMNKQQKTLIFFLHLCQQNHVSNCRKQFHWLILGYHRHILQYCTCWFQTFCLFFSHSFAFIY